MTSKCVDSRSCCRSLNGRTLPGHGTALTVKYADTFQEKQRRRDQTSQPSMATFGQALDSNSVVNPMFSQFQSLHPSHALHQSQQQSLNPQFGLQLQPTDFSASMLSLDQSLTSSPSTQYLIHQLSQQQPSATAATVAPVAAAPTAATPLDLYNSYNLSQSSAPLSGSFLSSMSNDNYLKSLLLQQQHQQLHHSQQSAPLRAQPLTAAAALVPTASHLLASSSSPQPQQSISSSMPSLYSSVFISSLPSTLNEAALFQLFSQYGVVRSARVLQNHDHTHSAMISMSTPQHALQVRLKHSILFVRTHTLSAFVTGC